jgi:hypothetical protein
MRKIHDTLKPGAIVRVKGYAPAVVLAVYGEGGAVFASVRHTATRPYAGFPAYFKKGEVLAYRAHECPPRDVVRVSRQSFGRLWWPSFPVVLSV